MTSRKVATTETVDLDALAPAEKPKETQQQKAAKAALHQLALVGGLLNAEDDIIFQGTKYVLPEKTSVMEAINFLHEKHREDERSMTFSREYLYRPWDGARATFEALRKAFGMVSQRSTTVQTLFGDTEVPPALITIPISAHETAQVPWGSFGVPHLKGVTLSAGYSMHREYGLVFQLQAEGPRKYRHHIEGIFKLVEEELKTNSLYRGKAFDGQDQPQFLDLQGVNPDKVIYSDLVTTQMEANIWALLRYPEKMQELGVPLKRAVLLEGPYGTGKTLAAYLTAQVAEDCGWSFLLCRPGRDEFKTVMATARLYQPAVVFFEDVDAVADVESDQVRQLLDIFDGIQAKGTQIICVLTTNHVEKIHKAMVRPGRLDAVIHIGALDADGIRKLVEATVPADLLSSDIDWKEVTDAMSGFLPAFCREAIDRTVRYNVARHKGTVTKLETMDFVDAALGLRPQLQLMEEAKDDHKTDPLSQAMHQTIHGAMNLLEMKDPDGDDVYQFEARNGGAR